VSAAQTAALSARAIKGVPRIIMFVIPDDRLCGSLAEFHFVELKKSATQTPA
jgi:hypothetical protein